MASRTIPTSAAVALGKRHIALAVDGAERALEQLKSNRLDWLNAQNVLDTCRLNMLAVCNVLLELLADELADYCEINGLVQQAMAQIETIGQTMTGKYLLNGPKAVRS